MINRFRITLLMICLLLFWLGLNDLRVQLRNPTPEILSLEQLLDKGASREWVTIVDGYQNLQEAISTSGTLELDALLVPLKRNPGQKQIDLLIETRDQELLSLFTEYNFHLDNESEKVKFRQEHADRFNRPRAVTGMVIGGMVADSNRSKLEKLAMELGMNVPAGIQFIAEGKEPDQIRAYFFLGVALLGLVKFVSVTRRSATLKS